VQNAKCETAAALTAKTPRPQRTAGGSDERATTFPNPSNSTGLEDEAELIHMKLPQGERLNEIAIRQMLALTAAPAVKQPKE